MSAQADIQRTARQKFALPGGRHDRLVRTLRVALPSIIGVLLAVLAFSPFSNTQEMSFVLAKDEVNLAKERMRVGNALYRGEDTKGRPFSLSAGSAVQKSAADPLLRMTDLSGRLVMDNGPATLSAGQGTYDMKAEKIRVEGPLSFASGDGFTLVASNVEFLLEPKAMQSFGPVQGRSELGNFKADELRADLQNKVIRLHGNVKFRIVPR